MLLSAWSCFSALVTLLAIAPSSCHARIDGLAYSQFGEGDFCLNSASALRDVDVISQYTRAIRLYGVACASTDAVLQRAQQLQMRVLLGVWLNGDELSNEQELAGLQRSLTAWGIFGRALFMGVAAGNEVLSVNGGSLGYLLQYIDRIRGILRPYSIPLTYVDIPEVWLGTHPSMASPPANDRSFTPGDAVAACRPQLPASVCALLRRVDWVGVNAHPFYAGVPATCAGVNVSGCYDGPAWVLSRVRELQRSLGTSDVVVTEVGYPSAGEACCSYAPTGFPANATFLARPSPRNAAAHLAGLTQALNAAGVTYFYFESFDAAWKAKWSPCLCNVTPHNYLQSCNGTCTYDYHWGLFNSLRMPKAEINMTPYLLPSSTSNVPAGATAVPGVGGASALMLADKSLVLACVVLSVVALFALSLPDMTL